MHHDTRFWPLRGTRLAAAATLTLLTLSSCKAEEETQAPRPRLVVSVSPTWMDGSSSATTEVLVTAVDATARVGSGTVLLRARAGVFANGAPEETLTLQDGSARTTFRCVVAENPLCAGPLPIRAEWNDVRSSATVELPGAESTGGVPVPGTGGNGSGLNVFSALANDRVWIWGTLQEGACWMDALAPVDAPTELTLGLPCYGPMVPSEMAIRPSDGALFYIGRGGPDPVLRRFVSEPLVYNESSDAYAYPGEPEKNDPIADTPACQDGVSDVMTGPGASEVLYRCGGRIEWYILGTSTRFQAEYFTRNSGDSVVHLGHDGRALVWPWSSSLVILERDGGTVTLTGVPLPSRLGPIRATESGFIVPGRENYDTPWSLYRIGYDGTVETLGSYGTESASVGGFSAIDLDGTGYYHGQGPAGVLDEAVFQLPLGGPASMVYAESELKPNRWTAPVHLSVYFHGSYLFTGP